jgi:PAS domain S-box-containing protein
MATNANPEPDNLTSVMEQNRWLTDEVKRRVDQLATINSVAAVVSQSLDLEATLDSALEAVMRVINVEATGISLVDHEAGELVLRAQRGWKRDFVKMGMRMKMGEGLSGRVIENDELVITGDVSQDSRIVIPAFAEEGVQAMALAPMHARGNIVGILSAMSYSPYEFSEEEITVLRAVADQVGVALDNARLFGQVVRDQSHLRAIVNSTAEAILAMDAEGMATLANETLCHWFDLDEKAVIGRPLSEMGLPEELLTGVLEATERANAGPTVHEVLLEDERYLAIHLSPLIDEEDQRYGWVTVFQDVTHYKEMEKLRSRVMHTAAHDLLNPMHVTESSLNMLGMKSDNLTDAQLSMVDLAHRGLDRMRALIHDMLQLERIESDVGIELKPTDLAAIIREVVEESRVTAEGKSQSLEMKLPRRLPKVMGEAKLLHRTLENYLSNAIKYTQDGGQIEVRAHKEGKQVFVRLFERFFRVTTGDEEEPGTGLGLAIVKSVVDRHAGKVWMRSKVGEGSTFGFSVPIAR